jgi:hypothetical protein
MLTKAQQAYFDEVVARAGKPSAELQLQIDEIRAAKTEDELKKIFSRDAEVERPKIEAELLCAVMLAKQAELNPSINAKKLEEENRTIQTTNHKWIGPCPKCKSEVLEGNTGYFCRAQGCGFKLGGVVMGQFLNSSQASKLFREGRTDLLSEFISKHGRQFSAYLIVDEFGDVRFDFPKRDSQEIVESQKTAAAKIVKTENPAALSKENEKAEPKQKQPTPLSSKPRQDQHTQKKSFITFKRCLIGGIWACAICSIGNGVDSSSSWFFTVPAAGLPWLIFKISDNETTGERMEAIEAIGVLLMGALLSLFSGLPVLIAFVFLKNVFASH